MRQHHENRKRLRGAGYFRRLGPGLITGAADDDPSGIGTYSQVGAKTGYGFLWVAPVLLPLAFAVEEACARIALVTGTGLAGVIKRRLPRPVLWVCVALVAVANIVNISADLSSMAAVLGQFIPLPHRLGVIAFGVAMGAAELFIPYHRYAKVLRWLCLSLVAYVAVLFVADVDWGQVLHSTLVPSFDWNRTNLVILIALAGTTISPYLFFWQAAEEVEDKSTELLTDHMRSMRVDVFSGMFSGIFVMFAIMTTTAATLHASGITDISTPQQAASALSPIAGSYAALLFSLGIIGTGLLAVPVLAGSTAYAVAETMGWRESLETKPRQSAAFYGVIVVAIIGGIALTEVGIDPIRGLYLAAILNGLAAPILLAAVWWLGRDRELLGSWRSPKWSQLLVGATVLAMLALPIGWLFAS